ncbi:prepilin-type N-terminal cleavage/methylation domain-containing protein [Vibrio sp. SM6]|uniref:Prepilin-type N-terminal cleavage/methylation domain-containing protein n=1 Tax=Vibrio agarilyticus TaxID=2726741 RepID=A0A7X8YID4_9VIBR|nr:prepilin-type N-terminal cleavage/methylation domain-containing protein [Vibrio agarilyticus]NLS14604.1 prepilin-type N-terminal cleavage/methylation domain-containing protein [Vibrio agarilyticus]
MMMRRTHGMTLIESIIALLVLAIAISALMANFLPQVRDSASAHYQTRAVMLGQSFLEQIMQRAFDEQSVDIVANDPLARCGENSTACTPANALGAIESGSAEAVAYFDDVDDYIGCWYSAGTQNECSAPRYPISNALGENAAAQYANFRVEIKVFYDADFDAKPDAAIGPMKRIEVSVVGGQYGSYTLNAYRGNF